MHLVRLHSDNYRENFDSTQAFPIPLQAALPLMFNCRMDQFLIHYINYPFSNSPRGIVL